MQMGMNNKIRIQMNQVGASYYYCFRNEAAANWVMWAENNSLHQLCKMLQFSGGSICLLFLLSESSTEYTWETGVRQSRLKL